MTPEQLEEVVTYIQREQASLWTQMLQMAALSQRPQVRSLTERRNEALVIQAKLHTLLRCPFTEIQIELLWERFSAEHMSRWWIVDDGTLALCVRWLQEISRQARGDADAP